MYVCVYMRMNVCICAIYVYVNGCVYLYTYILCKYVCLNVFTYRCNMFMYVYRYICMYVCIYFCM